MTVGDYLRLYGDMGVKILETPESKKQAEKMGLIYPPENMELKQIVKELHNIAQELSTLNRVLRQRR